MTAGTVGPEHTHTPSLPSPAWGGGLGWGRWAGGLYAIWLREVKRAVRDRGQLIGGVVRPLLYVLIMGIGLNPYFRGEIYGEVRFVVPYTYVQFLFPAVIALNIMYTSVQSAVSVIWDREFGFLREVLVSPMPRVAILLGKILGGTTVALFHGALVLALARFADLSMTLPDLAWGLHDLAVLYDRQGDVVRAVVGDQLLLGGGSGATDPAGTGAAYIVRQFEEEVERRIGESLDRYTLADLAGRKQQMDDSLAFMPGI